MTTSAVTNKLLGTTLTIHFQNGFTSLVNNDVASFSALEAIASEEGATSREIRFAIESARPVSNAQMVNPGMKNRPFVAGESSDILEKTATAKLLEVVAQFDQDVYERALQSTDEIYTGPMALEMYNQQVNAKESLVLQYFQDGSGAQAQISSVTGVSSGKLVVVVANSAAKLGCVYWLREGQKLVAYTAAGAAQVPTLSSGTHSYFKVTEINHVTKAVTLQSFDASDNALTITAANEISADDILYNASDVDQGGVFDRSAISDFGGLLYMPGLQSLAANDGRVVNGVTMSGSYAGTVLDKSGSIIFASHIGDALSLSDRRCGKGKYDYKTAKVSLAAWRALVDQDEGSKQLMPVLVKDPNGRGAKKFIYCHEDYQVEVKSDRFVPDYDMWIEPTLLNPMAAEDAGIKAPIQFKFTGFKPVVLPDSGSMFFNKINSSGRRVAMVETHMQTYGTFIATQSAAIIRVKGFSLS